MTLRVLELPADRRSVIYGHRYARLDYARVKRVADIVLIILTLPVTLFLIAACALAIRTTMGAPILYVQDRVGLGGRIFRIYKLRTMRPPGVDTQVATAQNDPRITPVGWMLRVSHLDELPQIWNILKGDMTISGPRPEQPALVELYRQQLPEYDLRHSVTPGLTGWAQVVSGYASDTAETTVKLAHDLHYVRNFGPMLDIKIAVRTVSVFLNTRYVR
jgi:lipopolysaccharide/colanic/teichoic acid biosynthesis glycosyltransferase